MPEALALGFDCSAAHCAAALLSGDRVLAARGEEMARGQAERLMPMLAEVLAEAGITWRDLAVIGVGTGPGSFTGTRIAVAAARGLALGLGIPAVGVSLDEVAGQRPAEPASAGADLPDPAAIAIAVARRALVRRHEPGPRPAPRYARPAPAAPARDRGPAILPG